MSQQLGFIVKAQHADLYSHPTNPKRMEIKHTNVKSILPGQQVWVVACGRTSGYKEVLGRVTFMGSVVITKDEYAAYAEMHQCPLEALPVKFVQRRGKEFVWGWKWSAFQPFTPADAKVFLPNKKGTVTWVRFFMESWLCSRRRGRRRRG